MLALPGGPYNYAASAGLATFTSVYGATSANGLWSLYFNQNASSNGGGLDGGWCLTFALVPPDLSISNTHNPANFRQGQTGDTYTITVRNNGPGTTSGPVTVTDSLPAGLTATAMSGTAWDCTSNTFPVTGPATLTCTRTAAFPPNLSFPAITLTVNVAADATSPVTNTATVSGSADTTPGNNTATDPTTVTQAADLTVTKTHSGNFKQSDVGDTYTITVSNLAGHGPTAGTVTVVDNPPTGLTITGMSGTNWTGCDVPTHTCTRSDALASGSSYEPIAVTVTVGTGLPFSVINQAVVSGGGELNAANDTANDTTTIIAPPGIVKAFGAATIPLNGSTSLTFTITNPAGNSVAMTGVSFTDNLPAGLVVATPNGLTIFQAIGFANFRTNARNGRLENRSNGPLTAGIEGCGGTITADSGSNSISLAGATIPIGGSCTFSVSITGTTPGRKNNFVTIASNEGGQGNTSNAGLTVVMPPMLTKAFGSGSFAAGGTTSLNFRISNRNEEISFTGVGFTDALPSGLLVATPNGLTGSCGAGTITAVAGSGSVSLSGGTFTRNECIFAVNVTGTIAGQKDNTTGNVTSTEGGTGETASASVTITPGPATHFTLAAPSSVAPGVPFNFTVTALDAYGNTASGYAGTVHFTSSDPSATLPANSAVTSGTGTFPATLSLPAAVPGIGTTSTTISVFDVASPSITGTSGPINVTLQGGQHLVVSAPASATAGTPFNVTVTMKDAANNTMTNYGGTVHFTSSDPAATLPANTTLTNGTGTFPATLNTVGSRAITAADTVNPSLAATSGAITVTAAAATHLTVAAPSSATPGTAINFTVTALDAFNNTATGYTGTVHFTSTDGAATLPVDSLLTNGTGTFPATLATVGSRTITATDTGTGTITGTSNSISVALLPVTHFSVTAPSQATGGISFNFTVQALDVNNNVVTSYAGTVHFTSSDPVATLPANSALTNGTGTFPATLTAPAVGVVGNPFTTISVADVTNSSITGTSGPINVTRQAGLHLVVSAPSSATAGTPFNVTVTMQDAFNNTVTNYSGTMHFTSSDPAATLPANATLTNGTGTFPATLKTVGSRTITAADTDSPLAATSGAIAVTAGAATHLTVAAPSSATPGTAINFTVTALDAFNNTATGYTGTVHFTSTDGAATLPGDSGLTNGTGTFPATLATVGSRTITATDTVTGTITGTSNSILVAILPVTHFSVIAPSQATAGISFNFTVQALDVNNNVVPSYAGTVHFTSSDPTATLPANSTLTNGTGTFPATLSAPTFVMVGNPTFTTISVADVANPSINGTSGPISTSQQSGLHLVVAAPSSATAGTPFNVTVTMQDALNNTVTNYSGTVHFTSSDPASTLPANTTLTNGTGTFPATLKTVGSRTITAADTVNPSLTTTSGAIAVTAGAATHLTVAAPSSAIPGTAINFTVTALDAFNNTATGYTGAVHFTSTDGAATLPVDSGLTNGTGTFPATLATIGSRTITATDTVTGTITGTSNSISVSVATLPVTHFLVTAPAQATAGIAFNFTVQALDVNNNVVTSYAGTVRFTSSDPAATLPANSTLTNGTGTFSATLSVPAAVPGDFIVAPFATISVVDVANPSIIGVSAHIVVVSN
ncbi:MAG: DUF11 domain-containing protein [Acidobacteriia bacterium]|nr:DUF11 domain-containing protein [Terriglobia bacterium]